VAFFATDTHFNKIGGDQSIEHRRTAANSRPQAHRRWSDPGPLRQDQEERHVRVLPEIPDMNTIYLAIAVPSYRKAGHKVLTGKLQARFHTARILGVAFGIRSEDAV
jgi:hypothetical protein